MNIKNFKISTKGLYIGLIITFVTLYLCVGFVSTLHSITFFHLANNTALAILLGIAYEIGQASVLFSILMTKNREQVLPWLLMILLTALQVTANVFASFKWMVESGSQDWIYWQKAILIGVNVASPQMYQIIISWIIGGLLPVVALGMTSLVANQLNHLNDSENDLPKQYPEDGEDIKSMEPITNIEKEQPVQSEISPDESGAKTNIIDGLAVPKKPQKDFWGGIIEQNP